MRHFDQLSYLPLSLSRDEWDDLSYVVVDCINNGDFMANLYLVFSNPADAVAVRVGLFPKWPTRLVLPLSMCRGGQLFLDRAPGRFKTQVVGANLGPEQIDIIELGAPEVALRWIEVSNFYVTNDPPKEFTFPAEPLVDAFQQWTSRDWPGKVRSLEELRSSLQSELEDKEPIQPSGRSRFAGFEKKRFESSGYFRTEKEDGVWWLVDPDGCAFWSAGINSVRPTTIVYTAGMERLFTEPLPDPETDSELFLGPSRYNALGINLRKALGADWLSRWRELTRRRMIRLGFNTVANWSEPQFAETSGIPRVYTMSTFPRKVRPLFRDFPDVWSKEFGEAATQFAEQLRSIAADPLVVGYFMDNEPEWAFIEKFDLGRQILSGPELTPARKALIEFLKEKYGSIDALNRSWKTSFQHFDSLLSPVDTRAFCGGEDTVEFTRRSVERLVRLPAQACRAVAPNHLNLGLRWAWIHSDYQFAGADSLDVFSINCYNLQPPKELFDRIARHTGRPSIIGEFHCGSIDRGLPSGGLVAVKTMDESLQAFRFYLENAAAHPSIVGAHYFLWNDQHVLGRADGENMQIGVCDIAGRLYAEWEANASSIIDGLLDVRTGMKPPYSLQPEITNFGCLAW